MFSFQPLDRFADTVCSGLVSLGKPSSAALEKLCAVTDVMLDDTAAKSGGAAALVNVKRDFLRP